MRASTPVAAMAIALAVGAGASAQDTVPPVKAEIVQVDVVVTNAQGKPALGLTQRDFELLEDGKPQRLTHFVLAGKASAGVPASEGASPSPSLPPSEPRAAEPGRGIVLVVDDLHIAPRNLESAKQALQRLLAEFVAPEDQVALVTTAPPSTTQQLTLDRAGLQAAVNRLRPREAAVAPARNSQMSAAQAELILRGDRNAVQLAARTLLSEPGSVFDTASPQAAAEAPAGATPAGVGAGGVGASADAKERVAEREVQRQARAVLSEALRFSVASLNTIESVLRSLTRLPGRKMCLVVSEGFLVGTGTSEERRRDLQLIVDAATRSGAVVYTLDPSGLVTTGGDAAIAGSGVSPGLQARVDRQGEQLVRTTLETLASDTGGFLVRGTNDLAAGLRRMIDDNETYYVMAYEPINLKRDGRFRKIEVKLPQHPGFGVRTRKGYFAPDDRKRAAAAVADPNAPTRLDESEARAALSAPAPADGIPVRLTADYLDLPPAGSQAVVRAHVDLTKLRWPPVEKGRHAFLELIGGVYDATGSPVGSAFGRVVDVGASTAEQKRAAAAGVQYLQNLALPPGRYEIRLLAREPTTGQAGTSSQVVDIPDLAEKTLTLSGVFLSTAAGDAAAGTEGVRDAHTLRRFKRGGSLYFQLYVYNPLVDDNGASDVVLQAQIWSGTSAVAASKPQPTTFQEKDGLPLPQTNGMSLEGLAAGPYELRVVAVDRKANQTVTRRVDFTVE